MHTWFMGSRTIHRRYDVNCILIEDVTASFLLERETIHELEIGFLAMLGN